MGIWKIVFLASFIAAVVLVRCDDGLVDMTENEVEPEYSADKLIRQKKSHPTTTCVPGINGATCTPDDEYTVSSSSNYYMPPVQPGFASAQPAPPQPQQLRQGYGPQFSQFLPQPGYGQQPSSHGLGPSPYVPAPYKPASHASYGLPPPPKSTYSSPPSQSIPPRSLYGVPIPSLYRTPDMMDDQHVHGPEMIVPQHIHRPDMMDEVGSFHQRPILPHCAPYQPAPAHAGPAPCSQQFTVSCTPQIYAASQTPSYQPIYYPPAPTYAAPKPAYVPSPIVYAPEPASMYQMQPHHAQAQPPNKPHTAYRHNENMMPNTGHRSNVPISSVDQQQIMDKNTSTTATMRNEAPNQQAPPKSTMINSNDGPPPKVNSMLKLADQFKENEKKTGLNAIEKSYPWEN